MSIRIAISQSRLAHLLQHPHCSLPPRKLTDRTGTGVSTFRDFGRKLFGHVKRPFYMVHVKAQLWPIYVSFQSHAVTHQCLLCGGLVALITRTGRIRKDSQGFAGFKMVFCHRKPCLLCYAQRGSKREFRPIFPRTTKRVVPPTPAGSLTCSNDRVAADGVCRYLEHSPTITTGRSTRFSVRRLTR